MSDSAYVRHGGTSRRERKFDNVYIIPILGEHCYLDHVDRSHSASGKPYFRTLFQANKTVSEVRQFLFREDAHGNVKILEDDSTSTLLCTVFGFANYGLLYRIPCNVLVHWIMNGDKLLSASVTNVFENLMVRYGNADTFHNLSFPIIHAVDTDSKEYRYIQHTIRQRKGLDPGRPEPHFSDGALARLSMSPF